MVRCRQKKLKLKLNTVFQVHGEIYRSITPFFCLLRLSLSDNISELTDSKFNHTVSKKTEMHLFVSFFCYLPQFTHDCESFPLTRQMEEAKIFNLSPLHTANRPSARSFVSFFENYSCCRCRWRCRCRRNFGLVR